MTQGGLKSKNTAVIANGHVHASLLLVHLLGDHFIAPSFEAWRHRQVEKRSDCGPCALAVFFIFDQKYKTRTVSKIGLSS